MAAAAAVKDFDAGSGTLNAALTASLKNRSVTAAIEYRHRITDNLGAYAVAAAQYSPRDFGGGFDASGSLGLSYRW